MAENGYGAPGHIGRIPNYGKTQVNPLGNMEPPACIQNAMMTKDKKPFTYTPGGLDFSQIKTPGVARRLARQRSLENHEQAIQQQQSNGQGGPMPPPPPPPQAPAPPPPPPLVIEVGAASKSPKLIPGERPEIVIPDNPISQLRKTNSPYHWEAEKAEIAKMGPVPKFVEKVPSPLTVKMSPSTFSQQPPQSYTPQSQNNVQRQDYPYGNQSQIPSSPVHRPEAQYAHQKPSTPPSTRDTLQRQDSQFNKSPQPFSGQSPISNGSPFSPSPNNNWKQPERRNSPVTGPQSPQLNRGHVQTSQQYSPSYQNQPSGNSGPVFHTLPRAGQKQDNYVSSNPNNAIFNNTREMRPQSPVVDSSNPTPWRTSTLNRQPKEPERQQNTYQNQNQQTYSPPWKVNAPNNNAQTENSFSPQWKQENKNVGNQQYQPPWVAQDTNNNRVENPSWKAQDTRAAPPFKQNQPQEQPRYQSTMSIPVTPKKPNPQNEYNNTPPHKEVVYVNQEPVYYCPDSPKSIPPWVKSQKEKTKTPPPEWVQRPLERKSVPRELVTPPRDQEPEWVRKSNEMQRNVREVISPPKYQQTVQPSWSTIPSENRKSLPRDVPNQGGRTVPIQTEDDRQPSHLRIVVGLPQNPQSQPQRPGPPQGNYSQPTQRIMRVLSPQLVRLDDGPQHDLPTLNRSFQNNQDQPKTRIIPIQIEGGNASSNQRVYYHKFTQEGPPRQSKAFKVLQVITGTQDLDQIQHMENEHGFTDV